MFLFLMITFSIALVLNTAITPLILHIAHHFKWYDVIEERKIHKGAVPRLGGVGMFVSFLVASILSYLSSPALLPSITAIDSTVWLVFAGYGLVHFVGLVDDFNNIRAILKLIGQIVGGILLVLGGVTFSSVSLPFGAAELHLGWLSGPATVFLLISLSNALNLIDGIDGLAGGIAFVASTAIGTIHVLGGSVLPAMFSFALAGAILGFLVYNRPKARIFMGDSGSIFLGFALASLLFLGENPTVSRNGFVAIVAILIVPIGDMLAAMVRRLRRGQAVYHADREHVHHKLLDIGVSVRGILLRLLVISSIAALSGVLFVASRFDSLVPPWLGIVSLTLSVTGVTVFFVAVHVRYNWLHRQTSRKQ